MRMALIVISCWVAVDGVALGLWVGLASALSRPRHPAYPARGQLRDQDEPRYGAQAEPGAGSP